MRIEIWESERGEFEGISPLEFESKLRKGLASMISEGLSAEDIGALERGGGALMRLLLGAAPDAPTACSCGDPNCGAASGGEAISKAKRSGQAPPARGGELRLVEDLTVMLSKSYAKTLERMRAHVEGAAQEALEAAHRARESRGPDEA